MRRHRGIAGFVRGSLLGLAFFAVLGLFGAVLAATAGAQTGSQGQVDLQGKVRRGDEVVVPAGETVNSDLYAMGRRIRIEGRVVGDVVAFGSEIDVDGDVLGDLLAAGGRVRLAGTVNGDARIAGGQVALSGPVREDVLATAGDLAVTSRSAVGQDLVFAAGQSRIDGAVAGGILGTAGSYARTGVVGGTERVTVNEGRQRARPTLGRRLLNALSRYVVVVVFGVIMLLLGPRLLQSVTAAAQERPVASFGVGILVFIAFFVAVFLIIVTTGILAVVLGALNFKPLAGLVVFGGLLTVGALVFALLLLVLYLAYVVVGLVIGRLLLRGSAPVARPIAAMLVGVLVLVILRTIPVLGPAVGIVTVLIGIGAVFLLVRPRRPAPAPPPPMPPPVTAA